MTSRVTKIYQLFGAGILHHQAGQFAEAEMNLSAKFLGLEANHAGALHHLGLIASRNERLSASRLL